MVSYHLYFPELIETLWNVNNDELSSRSFAARELIETLWNVNVTNISVNSEQLDELIETLWNVNYQRRRGSTSQPQN